MHASCYPYKVALLSCPNSSLTTNICSLHTLIFQAGGYIAIRDSWFFLLCIRLQSYQLLWVEGRQWWATRSLCCGGNNSFFGWKTSWNSPACQYTIYPPHLEPDIIWLHKSWLDKNKFELSSKTKSELSDPAFSRTYLFHCCTSKSSQQS